VGCSPLFGPPRMGVFLNGCQRAQSLTCMVFSSNLLCRIPR
jgi:hypothetical protein